MSSLICRSASGGENSHESPPPGAGTVTVSSPASRSATLTPRSVWGCAQRLPPVQHHRILSIPQSHGIPLFTALSTAAALARRLFKRSFVDPSHADVQIAAFLQPGRSSRPGSTGSGRTHRAFSCRGGRDHGDVFRFLQVHSNSIISWPVWSVEVGRRSSARMMTGVVGERPGYRDPLLLAAGEFVRPVEDPLAQATFSGPARLLPRVIRVSFPRRSWAASRSPER